MPHLLLCADGKEALAPDQTANPIIHRFYSYMATHAADKDFPLPAPHEDVLINETFDPRPAVVQKAQSVLQTLPEHLHVKSRVCLWQAHVIALFSKNAG